MFQQPQEAITTCEHTPCPSRSCQIYCCLDLTPLILSPLNFTEVHQHRSLLSIASSLISLAHTAPKATQKQGTDDMAADTPGPADRPHGGLYSHYCKITDANTKEAVGAKTMLAVMDCRDNASEKNNYLSSHTGVAACAVRFRLYLEDGTSFPPHVNQNELGYGLHLTFNHLVSRTAESRISSTDTETDVRSEGTPRMPLLPSRRPRSHAAPNRRTGVPFLVEG